MKYYIETSVWVVYTFAREKEKKRFSKVKRLVDLINQGDIEALTSLYSLIELYQVGIDNFDMFEEACQASKEAIVSVLETKITLLPMLDREEILINRRKFEELEDSTDLPHAILSYLYNCDGIIAYDSHFDAIDDIIPHFTPEDLVDKEID